jgi:diketogulonate reductase-like aldo/keto reductase
VYLLHWPYPFLWKHQWRRLEKIYLNGEVDVIGVCNFEKKHLEKLLRICKVKPAINQFERHPAFQQKETFDFCKKNNIQVMCYSPLARNSLTLQGNEVLQSIAKKHNKSIGQIILKWDIINGCIPIPGSKSEEHIITNIDLEDFTLSEAELASIDKLERNERIRFAPDMRFSKSEKAKMLICSILIYLHIPLELFRH